MSVASDLDAMLRGWDSVPFTLGAVTGRGILSEMDVFDSDKTGDPVLVRRTVLVVRKADFLNSVGTLTVSRGDAVTIDDTAYVVSDPRVGAADGAVGGIELDGRELHLVVRKV